MEAGLCPGGCGQPKEESWSPDNQDRYTVHRVACHACAARDRAARQLTGDSADGAFFYTTLDPLEEE